MAPETILVPQGDPDENMSTVIDTHTLTFGPAADYKMIGKQNVYRYSGSGSHIIYSEDFSYSCY